jgi:nitroimidazol reductase NimA-like FMN-containing flavoprotein (pyridoxamine 5'-phosphate oxidase superfamily)
VGDTVHTGRRHGPLAEPWIEPLELDECIGLLRSSTIGRIAVLVDGLPVILPVNHLLVERAGVHLVFLRTRSGSTIDRAPAAVAFQIDGFDQHHREGWSVLVRGHLDHADDTADRDPAFESWVGERDRAVVIVPTEISGRRLHASPTEWPFHPQAYL